MSRRLHLMPTPHGFLSVYHRDPALQDRLPIHTFEPATLHNMHFPLWTPETVVPVVPIVTLPTTGYLWRFFHVADDHIEFWSGYVPFSSYIQTFCRKVLPFIGRPAFGASVYYPIEVR